MIWRSSYAKGTQDITLRRKTKKVPVPNEGTKRSQMAAMPQADQSGKT